MADLIPGINVGAAWRRLTGDTSRGDEDIIAGFSKSGGDRTTANGATFGVTAQPVASPTPEPPLPLPIPDEAGVDGTGGGLLTGAAADPDAGLRTALRNEIAARGGDIEGVYAALFGDLDALLKTRDAELETQYGDQFKKAADTYTGAIPEIEGSYAAIGAGDSTDNSDAKGKAKAGYDETTKVIGKNKESDKAKLGQYGKEQRAKFGADKEAAQRNVARAGETEDVDALRSMRNDLETNISQGGVTRATLGTDGAARKEISNLTQDSGRYDAAVNALDSIIKGSMSGSVKEAAVKAIVDNAGLSDDEKEKVNQQYGNVYAEQQAL